MKPIWKRAEAWFAVAVAAFLFMCGVGFGTMRGVDVWVATAAFNAAFVVVGVASAVALWLDVRQLRKGSKGK